MTNDVAAAVRRLGADRVIVENDYDDGREQMVAATLPLTAVDWTIMAWVAERVADGDWGRPWAVALEYGGEGPIWQAITDEKVLAEQVPRLVGLFDQADRGYPAFAEARRGC